MVETEPIKETNVVICAHFELTEALEEIPLLEIIGRSLSSRVTRIFLVINRQFARFYQNLPFKCIQWDVDLNQDQGLLTGHRVAVEYGGNFNFSEFYALNSSAWSALLGVSLKSPVRVGRTSTLEKNLFTEVIAENKGEHFCTSWQKYFEKVFNEKWEPMQGSLKIPLLTLKDLQQPYIAVALPWLEDNQSYNLDFNDKKWSALCKELVEENILFLGPVKGTEKWHKLARELAENKKVKNLIGLTSPIEYLSLLNSAEGVISPEPSVGGLANVLRLPAGVLGKIDRVHSPYNSSCVYFQTADAELGGFLDKFYQQVDKIKFNGG